MSYAPRPARVDDPDAVPIPGLEPAARPPRRLPIAPDPKKAKGPTLLPLDLGEQYRFRIDVQKCIGCHCCEVACAEQNGNPPGVDWRRVGDFEGGEFPDARRMHLSMSCNHCLEPACLVGCPTNAYVKLENGVVQHRADDCIGCEYCTWNCPYGVPVFNPDRRIVTKCDMCQPRLEAGQMPACVSACPTEAIAIEKVNVAAWRADHREADAPHLPSSDISLSTTRIVLPDDVPLSTVAASEHHLIPAYAHWSLILLTLLTQLSLGAEASTLAVDFAQGRAGGVASTGSIAGGAVAAFVSGAVALGAAFFHLGRPIHGWKALRNLRRSWMSREVLLFTLFAFASMAYAAAQLFARGAARPIGAAALLLGVAGVYASGRIYMVPARPAWNSPRTLAAFFLTAIATGPLFALAFVGARVDPAWARILVAASAAGVGAQLLVQLSLLGELALRSDPIHRGTARLLLGRFRALFVSRVAAAVLAVFALANASHAAGEVGLYGVLVAGALAMLGELGGRYLFYVTVVPHDMPGTFFRLGHGGPR